MKINRRSIFNSVFVRLVLGVALIYCYSEYATHYVIQMQCGWPDIKKEPANNVKPVYAMVLADIHLQGSLNGHWFDRWRRESQMHRTFQTAMTLHKPEVVFVLGDLFEEGKWCSHSEFNYYVKRFYSLFKVPEGTDMYIVVGNHDIGFHYRITPRLARRFENKLNSSIVQMISIRGNHFVLINSMAMQGDGCSLCSRAVDRLKTISEALKCSQGFCKGDTDALPYSRPIIMQHFPLYRHLDSICTDPDSAPLPKHNKPFNERWDCLSEKSTLYLVEKLDPRAAFVGHTHQSCMNKHTFESPKKQSINLTEYTVPSFNWRNRLDPKYYLVTITPDEVEVNECEVITEGMLLVNAILLFVVLLLYLRSYSRARNAILNKDLSPKQI